MGQGSSGRWRTGRVHGPRDYVNDSYRKTLTSRTDLEPAAELVADDRFEHRHAVVAVVEARDVGVELATRMLELLAAGDGDLLERLDAIGGEGRGEDGDLLLALARQRFEG